EGQILTGRFWQFLQFRNSLGRSAPARHFTINTFDLTEATVLRRCLFRFFSVNLVSNAHWNLRQLIQYIQFGYNEPGDSVNHASVTQEWQVKPTAAAWTSRDRAEFVASFAQHVTIGVKGLGGEGATSTPRAICLGEADDR